MSDPAHMAAEITFMLIVDLLVLGLIWPLIKRLIDRKLAHAHRELDREHGIVHDPITGEPQRKEDT